MRVIEVKNVEPTVVLELTQSQLGTLIAAFAITGGGKREEFAKNNNVKVLPYMYPNDQANEFFSQISKFYKNTFGGK